MTFLIRLAIAITLLLIFKQFHPVAMGLLGFRWHEDRWVTIDY